MKQILQYLVPLLLLLLCFKTYARQDDHRYLSSHIYEEGGVGFTGDYHLPLEIVFQKDGKAIIGGQFSAYNGHPVTALIRLNQDGSLDNSFNSKVRFELSVQGEPAVSEIVQQPDGKLIVSGIFDSYKGWPAKSIIRLNPDGSRDHSFDAGTGFDGNIRALALQPDGKLLVAGSFTTFRGNPVSEIVRLNPNGSLDETFEAELPETTYAGEIALQPDGKVLVAVWRDLVRLNPDGSRDPSFDLASPYGDSFVHEYYGLWINEVKIHDLYVLDDGKILLGGDLRTDMKSTTALLRLNPDGSIDEEFSQFDSEIGAVFNETVLTPDNKIYVLGMGTMDYYAFYRYNLGGTSAGPFSPEYLSQGNMLGVQEDGKVIAAMYYDVRRIGKGRALLRFHEDGSIDRSFNPKEQPGDGSLTEVIRINSGGGDIGFEGENWQADQFYTGGDDYARNVPIANTENDLLYQSERNGNVTYDIPVSEEGLYTVELHFAEIHWDRPNARLFRLSLEGEQVGETIDLYGDHGGSNTAYVLKVEDLEVVDGSLTVELVSEKDRAKISGIAVFKQKPTPEPEYLRINAGGEALDLDGEVWLADRYYSGGRTHQISSGEISNTEKDELYRSERYGDFSYRLPATEDGLYTVELHFSEIHWDRPEARVFEVEVEDGQFFLEDIDLFRDQGGSHRANILMAENIAVTDGWLDIKLTPQKDNAKISGVVMYKQPTATDTLDKSLIARINTGGGQLKYGEEEWAADQYFSGGSTYANSSQTIGNTDRDELFHTERYGDFSYNIPVPESGLYTLELHFSEIHWDRSGARIFDVEAEGGQYALEDLDLFDELGGSFRSGVFTGENIAVNDGVLDINFLKEKDNPKISGIVVYKQSAVGESENTVTTMETSMSEEDSLTGLTAGEEDRLLLYPNPTEGRFRVEFEAEQSGEWEAVLVDASGNSTFLGTYSLEQGIYSLEFDLSQYNLIAGKYYLQMRGGDGATKTGRLVIR